MLAFILLSSSKSLFAGVREGGAAMAVAVPGQERVHLIMEYDAVVT